MAHHRECNSGYLAYQQHSMHSKQLDEFHSFCYQKKNRILFFCEKIPNSIFKSHFQFLFVHTTFTCFLLHTKVLIVIFQDNHRLFTQHYVNKTYFIRACLRLSCKSEKKSKPHETQTRKKLQQEMY